MAIHRKAYLEITNRCNLSCAFCPGTDRTPGMLTEEAFTQLAARLRPWAEYLFYHLMGEPLLHPDIDKFFNIAGDLGFKVIITTNGTLIPKRRDILLNSPSLHKVSISLHAYEANKMKITLDEYLDGCFDFCREASEKGIFCIMRLWNVGGEDTLNKRAAYFGHIGLFLVCQKSSGAKPPHTACQERHDLSCRLLSV